MTPSYQGVYALGLPGSHAFQNLCLICMAKCSTSFVAAMLMTSISTVPLPLQRDVQQALISIRGFCEAQGLQIHGEFGASVGSGAAGQNQIRSFSEWPKG